MSNFRQTHLPSSASWHPASTLLAVTIQYNYKAALLSLLSHLVTVLAPLLLCANGNEQVHVSVGGYGATSIGRGDITKANGHCAENSIRPISITN